MIVSCTGKPRVDDRLVLNGMNFINRNGLRWRDAPNEYCPRKTLYSRRTCWSDERIFTRMMDGLASEAAAPVTVTIDVSGHAPLVLTIDLTTRGPAALTLCNYCDDLCILVSSVDNVPPDGLE